MTPLFLDANAHIPLSSKASNKLAEFNNSIASHGHPSSPSLAGRNAAAAMEESRFKIAKLIGADSPNQIIFTNSCTQACEWAYKILKKIPGHLYISQLEHPASKDGCVSIGGAHELIPITSDGVVDISSEIDADAISCIYVQNEIGSIQPIQHLKKNNFLFSDMSQALGKIPVDVGQLGVDLAAFGSHKFGGPSGFGFLYIKDTSKWVPFGSGSRYGLDIPGTPNVAGAVGTAAALEEAIETLSLRTRNMKEFQVNLEIGLEQLGFEIIGKNVLRCPNTTFAKVPDDVPERAIGVMFDLGDRGIHVGLGSACGSMYTGGSPLMRVLGRPSDGQDYLRFSQWGEYGAKEAELVLNAIKEVL